MNSQHKNLVVNACQHMKQWGIYFEWQKANNGFAESVGLGEFFSDGDLVQDGGSSYLTGDEAEIRSVFQNAQVGKDRLNFICLIDNSGNTIKEKQA